MRRLPFVALSLLSAGLAGAQDARTLERRLQIAMHSRDSAARVLADYRLRHPPRAFSDSFGIPGTALRVVATPDVAGLARDGAVEAGRILARQLGENISLIAPATYFVRSDSSNYRGATTVSGIVRGRDEVFNRETRNATTVADGFVANAKASLLDRIDSSFRRQLAGSLPLDTVTDAEWSSIRLTLATSYSVVAQRCLTADVPSCEKVLGLVPLNDPATELMDATGRRGWVSSVNYWWGTDRFVRQDCISGNDASCLQLVRREGRNLVLGGRGIASLTSEAMRIGGAGALTRMLNGHGNQRELLQAMSGLPVDSVVAIWARKVRDRGTVSSAFSVSIALVSILWIAAFIFFAARSSRWR